MGRHTGPFVGRETEDAALDAARRAAAAGERRVILLAGEPGVGKTTLTERSAAAAQNEGFLVLTGGCDAGLGVPYQPFVEAMRGALAQLGSATVESLAGPNAAHLALLAPELRPSGVDLPPPLRNDPDASRYGLLEAMVSFVTSVSRTQPVLLVLEDLHWAAVPTLAMVRHLVRSDRPRHLLVVATYRDTEPEANDELVQLIADVSLEPGVERLGLDGLDPAELRALAAEVVGPMRDADDARLAADLHRETNGNAFFAVELLRHFVDSGAVREDNGVWRYRPAPEGSGVPERLREVVLSRVGALSDTANELVELAAVAGVTSSQQLLTAVLGDDDAVLDAIDQSLRAHVLVEDASNFAFPHSLVREAVRDSLTTTRRSRLHVRIGEALERLPARQAPLDALAAHFAEGARAGRAHAQKAVRYALDASRRAIEQLAFEEAVAVLERSRTAALAAGYREATALAELLVALADARELAGDLDGTKQAALEAATFARTCGSGDLLAQAAVLYGRWVVIDVRDDSIDALCDDALAALPDDAFAWRSRVLTTRANYEVFGLGHGADASAIAQEGLTCARRSGEPDAIGRALYVVAASLLGTPDTSARLALADELIEVSEAAQASRNLLDGLVMRANTRLELGDLAGFDADAAALCALGERSHWWAATFLGRALQVNGLMVRGRLGDADALIDTLLSGGPHDVNALNAYAAQLFLLRREQGRLEELEPLVAAIVADNPGIVGFRAALAALLVELGRPDEARPYLEALVVDGAVVAPRDQTWLATVPLLAEVAAMTGDRERAGVLLDELRPFAGLLAVAGSGVICLGAVDRFLGILTGSLGDVDGAHRWYESALALEERCGAEALATRTRSWFGRFVFHTGSDEARARELLGRARTDAERLGISALARQLRPPG